MKITTSLIEYFTDLHRLWLLERGNIDYFRINPNIYKLIYKEICFNNGLDPDQEMSKGTVICYRGIDIKESPVMFVGVKLKK